MPGGGWRGNRPNGWGGSQWPAPATETPLKVARRLAIGVLRPRATRTLPAAATQEMPGVSPRAGARRAAGASAADGAAQTTRTARAAPAIVPVPAARRNAWALFPVASAITTSGARSPSDAISHTLFMTPRGITPVPVGVSLATHTRASAPASRARFTIWSDDRRLPAWTICRAID